MGRVVSGVSAAVELGDVAVLCCFGLNIAFGKKF